MQASLCAAPSLRRTEEEGKKEHILPGENSIRARQLMCVLIHLPLLVPAQCWPMGKGASRWGSCASCMSAHDELTQGLLDLCHPIQQEMTSSSHLAGDELRADAHAAIVVALAVSVQGLE